MNSSLNPEIRTIIIGKKKLREMKIYPLSISDQFKLTSLLNGLITIAVAAASHKSDTTLLGQIIGLLMRNLKQILKLVTDEPKGFKRFFLGRKPILSDLTNSQMEKIVMAIYEVNYEDILKKVTSLLKGKGKNIPEPLRRLWQSSSENIPNSDSTISTESDGKKEV